eukprot:c11664_g1_i1.p1 GENE.c11664_g1_i1~~c11664_g1_i1.p1  ORF type:complete len:330 (+),score=66.70 c11664_g1_i1:124-990(+)
MVQTAVFLYLPLCAVTLQYFDCTEVDRTGIWVQTHTPAQRCYTPSWRRALPLAVIASVVYAAGIPLAITAVLWWERRRVSDHTVLVLRYMFLVGRYRESQFLFEAAIMARTLAVVLALVVFRGAQAKASVTVLVLTFGAMHVLSAAPFAQLRHTRMSAVVLSFVAAVMVAAMANGDTNRASIVGFGLVGFLAALLGGVGYDLVLLRRDDAAAGATFEAADDLEMSTAALATGPQSVGRNAVVSVDAGAGGTRMLAKARETGALDGSFDSGLMSGGADSGAAFGSTFAE